ncbi:MAG: hypothetical protein QME35_09090 [Thermoanaerobacteraceae bacterium]|nr:hypothetical protein [Thermoanaerobacteraceae bacterium]
MKKIIIFIYLLIFAFSIAGCSNSSKKQETIKKETKIDNMENKKISIEEEKRKALGKKAQEGYNAFLNKKYDDAIAIEDEVLKEDPNCYTAYSVKGITLCYSHDYEEGSKYIDKALSINPNDYLARFNKALSLELYGHYDEAIYWYKKAIEIEKGAWSYYGIASIYGRRGDVENTIKYLKLSIEIDPNVKKEAINEPDFAPVKNSKEFINLIK